MTDAWSKSRPGPRIFLSYRRTDSAGHTGRLYDALVARFGRDQVFMDVDAIRPGSSYPEVLDDALARCGVLLALIGPTWLTSSSRRGRRRLDDPNDGVRQELDTALRRGTLVIPVLVDGAEMPPADRLPGPLRALATHQAVQVSDRRWPGDVQALVEELDRVLGRRDDGGRRRRGRRGARTGTAEQQRPGRAGSQIDAQLAYNLAALQARGAAVDQVMGTTRRELVIADRRARADQRSMDATGREIASATGKGQKALLQKYGLDRAALVEQVEAQNDGLFRVVDGVLNGPGALAAAPQPLPELPPAGPRSQRRKPGGR